MNSIKLFCFSGILAFHLGVAQQNLDFNEKLDFKEGIYLNHQQFRLNKPIPPSRINSSVKSSSADYWVRILSSKEIEIWLEDGSKTIVARSSLFGVCMHGAPYVQTETGFYKLIIIGSLCYFPANTILETIDPAWGYPPYYTSIPQGSMTTTSSHLNYFFFEANNGEIQELTTETLEPYLEKSKNLNDEFNALRKKQKRKMLPYFIRKYNLEFPLSF